MRSTQKTKEKSDAIREYIVFTFLSNKAVESEDLLIAYVAIVPYNELLPHSGRSQIAARGRQSTIYEQPECREKKLLLREHLLHRLTSLVISLVTSRYACVCTWSVLFCSRNIKLPPQCAISKRDLTKTNCTQAIPFVYRYWRHHITTQSKRNEDQKSS